MKKIHLSRQRRQRYMKTPRCSWQKKKKKNAHPKVSDWGKPVSVIRSFAHAELSCFPNKQDVENSDDSYAKENGTAK
jgi:hypothetical protein